MSVQGSSSNSPANVPLQIKSNDKVKEKLCSSKNDDAIIGLSLILLPILGAYALKHSQLSNYKIIQLSLIRPLLETWFFQRYINKKKVDLLVSSKIMKEVLAKGNGTEAITLTPKDQAELKKKYKEYKENAIDYSLQLKKVKHIVSFDSIIYGIYLVCNPIHAAGNSLLIQFLSGYCQSRVTSILSSKITDKLEFSIGPAILYQGLSNIAFTALLPNKILYQRVLLGTITVSLVYDAMFNWKIFNPLTKIFKKSSQASEV